MGAGVESSMADLPWKQGSWRSGEISAPPEGRRFMEERRVFVVGAATLIVLTYLLRTAYVKKPGGRKAFY